LPDEKCIEVINDHLTTTFFKKPIKREFMKNKKKREDMREIYRGEDMVCKKGYRCTHQTVLHIISPHSAYRSI